MTAPLDPLEDALMKFVTGELDPDSGAGRELLHATPGLAEAWAEHRAVGLGLEGLAQLERAAVEEPQAPGDEALRDLARRGLEERYARAPRPTARSWALLAAAALLLILGGVAWWAQRDTVDDFQLGTGAVELLAPEDGGRFEGEFRWACEDRRAGDRFRVRIETDADVFESRALDGLFWRPGQREVDAWGDGFRWSVLRIEPGADPVESRSRRASL